MADPTADKLENDPSLQDVEILSTQTESMGEVFGNLNFSLLVSTYQAGKLVVVHKTGDVVGTHFANSQRPMGIAAMPGQIAVGTTGEIQFWASVPTNVSRLDAAAGHDACYVPRYSHLTGAIDIHEMAYGADGQIWFINTQFSALCTLNGSTSFQPVWRPPFISAWAAEDRCHLNGLGMMNGRPRYVTALGETDRRGGWRERKADGGVLIDLADGKILCRGLSMPHSPRWYANQLWVCESGKGTLSKVDYRTGEIETFFEFPGFTRGLDFVGPLAFVGLSRIRETATFSGLPITEKAQERNCGIWVVDTTNGELIGILRFTQGVHEIFAVQALPGIRYPAVLDKLNRLALDTYFLPGEIAQKAREAQDGASVTAASPVKS